MLYLDTPVDAGFSYSEIVDGVLDLTTQTTIVALQSTQKFTPNATHIPGRLPAQDPSLTPNTTDTNIRTLWNAVQLWLKDFPHHNATDKISTWTSSVSVF